MLKAVAAGSGGSGASGITIGASVITGGTNTRVLFDDNGVIGEDAGLTYVKASGLLTATQITIGAGSAITSSGPGGALTALAYAASGTGVVTALGNTAGAAGGFALFNTNPYNLTGPITSVGNATSIASQTGTGSTFVVSAAPTITGVLTASGSLTLSGSGAASTAVQLLSGTLFTGGSGTTTFPQMLFQPTGTAAVTTWSTAGTGLGMNMASGFTGDYFSFSTAGGGAQFRASAGGAFVIGAGFAYQWNGRGTLSSPASGSVQLGLGDAAAPSAQTLRAQSVIAGTSNVAGQSWSVVGSLSTGSGTSGDIIFQTGGTGAAATVQNTATTALTIKGATQAITIASGKSLVLGNAATTGLTAGVLAATTNASIVITDSTGQAYRIPCII